MDVLPGLHSHQTLILQRHCELSQIWGRVSDLETLVHGILLLRSMPARLQAVIDADGHPTPYWWKSVKQKIKSVN